MLHAVLLMESKLINVATIVTKRGLEGRTQASLALAVVSRFITDSIGEIEPRATLNMVKRVVRFADTDEAKYCWYHYSIDVLRAVPVDALNASSEPAIQRFMNEGLPIDLRHVDAHRARYKSIVDRQKAF